MKKVFCLLFIAFLGFNTFGMKKLEVFNGGHPITANDLSWLQTSAKETLEYVVKGLCGIQQNNPSLNQNTPYQLFGQRGQVATGIGVSYAGAIYYKGEVYKVEPGTLVNPNAALLFKKRYGANNPVTYANATTKNVHVERYLEIGIKTGLTAGVDYIEWSDVVEVDVIRRDEFTALEDKVNGTEIFINETESGWNDGNGVVCKYSFIERDGLCTLHYETKLNGGAGDNGSSLPILILAGYGGSNLIDNNSKIAVFNNYNLSTNAQNKAWVYANGNDLYLDINTNYLNQVPHTGTVTWINHN